MKYKNCCCHPVETFVQTFTWEGNEFDLYLYVPESVTGYAEGQRHVCIRESDEDSGYHSVGHIVNLECNFGLYRKAKEILESLGWYWCNCSVCLRKEKEKKEREELMAEIKTLRGK